MKERKDCLTHFLVTSCTCEETCESIWPPNASLYASSTCDHLPVRLTRAYGCFGLLYWAGSLIKCEIKMAELILAKIFFWVSRIRDAIEVHTPGEKTTRSNTWACNDGLAIKHCDRSSLLIDPLSRFPVTCPRQKLLMVIE